MKYRSYSAFSSEKKNSRRVVLPPSPSFGFQWISDKKGCFSLYVPEIQHAKLTLYSINDLDTPIRMLEGYPSQEIISFSIDHLPSNFAYSWKVTRGDITSPEFADPWNPLLAGKHQWKGSARHDRSLVTSQNHAFSGDLFEKPGECDLRLYECHVRAASQKSLSSKAAGTYKDLIPFLDHVKISGFNAIELLPIQEFDEKAASAFDHSRVNYWGYMPLHPQSLMRGYSATGESLEAEHSFALFVKTAHERGIRVVLDLVFNHLDSNSPMAYCLGDHLWLKDVSGRLVDYTGCGNTVNCQHPIVREWIRFQLYHWVYSLGIDGFRFDLACALYRQSDGSLVFEGSLLHQLRQDPWLKDRIWINEPWDAAGAWDLGQSAKWGFFEWNDRYRDDVRSYIHFNTRKDLAATRVCGSNDLFYPHPGKRSPFFGGSIQYIACHDGFCLADLVSYNERHNLANGEDGRDGHEHNLSFNHGVEGPTDNEAILKRREQQIRNFMTFLAISKGPIMMLAGDEYGHTRQGNNNPWCQDNEINALDWDKISQKPALLLFWQKLMKWRQSFSLFKPGRPWDYAHVIWHGFKLNQPTWHETNGPLAVELKSNESTAFAIFNTSLEPQNFEIPKDRSWYIVGEENPVQVGPSQVSLSKQSSLLLSDLNLF